MLGTLAHADLRVSARAGVHFRSSPNGHIIDALSHGAHLKQIGAVQGIWVPVSYHGKRGWIAKAYLRGVAKHWSTQPSNKNIPIPTPRPDTPKATTEASLRCPTGECDGGPDQTPDDLDQISTDEISGAVPIPTPRPKPPKQSLSKCYSNAILKAAKTEVRKRFHNRSHSGGQCAKGVRLSLGLAGVYPGGSLGPSAVYYQYHPVLKNLGFVNMIGQYNAQNAPPGSVLVFRGPYSEKYRKTGRYGHPAGNWLGHITIKGDDGRYYTDGRTPEPAIAHRYLIGVWVMVKCVHCTSKMKRACHE